MNAMKWKTSQNKMRNAKEKTHTVKFIGMTGMKDTVIQFMLSGQMKSGMNVNSKALFKLIRKLVSFIERFSSVSLRLTTEQCRSP